MSKTNKKKSIVVFTDGSCAGNGKNNAAGGIGIHFPNRELKDVSKIFRLGCCTNQRTELYAILTAIKYIKQNFDLGKYQICIKTDSQYSIDCVTKWVYGWIKNGWKTKNNTPVANKEFIEAIHNYYENYNITFVHVDAHTGMDDFDSVANARADKLATRATERAQMEKNTMYGGNFDKKSTKKSGSKSGSKSSQYQKKKNYGKKTYHNGFPSDNNFIVELVKSIK